MNSASFNVSSTWRQSQCNFRVVIKFTQLLRLMSIFLSWACHQEYTSRAISHSLYRTLVSSVKPCDSLSILVLWVFHYYLTIQSLQFTSLKRLHILKILYSYSLGSMWAILFFKLHLTEMMYFRFLKMNRAIQDLNS